MGGWLLCHWRLPSLAVISNVVLLGGGVKFFSLWLENLVNIFSADIFENIEKHMHTCIHMHSHVHSTLSAPELSTANMLLYILAIFLCAWLLFLF